MPETAHDTELAALTTRIRELSDRIELRELFDAYVTALDLAGDPGDRARYTALFTEDATFTFPIGTCTGITAYTAFQAAARARWAHTHHLSANHTITLHGDRARLRVHQSATHLHHTPGHTPFTIGGHYDAHAVRTPGGWRLNRVAFHVTWTTGTSPDPLPDTPR
ncbi:nuclear transport factor 2 family protein [Streptomyces sp. CAU 1734]|uniref:nuclear transport factor 2 family protein n=1 Tax=Streptomyces sp. CAU 1734 TaxID=3140360 RepID=UPI0032616AFD